MTHEADEKRLRSMLPGNQCFLVATRRVDASLIGYLTMRRDYINQIGLISDLVVARPYRRTGIASRLVAIAGVWAKEHDLTRLIIETQTKNYPSILFCQQLVSLSAGTTTSIFATEISRSTFSQSLR